MIRRAIALLAVGIVLLAASSCRRASHASPEETRQYAASVSFSNFRMSAAENMAGHTVYEIEATVANKGNRTITELRAEATFRDLDSMAAYREEVLVIGERRPPLAAGQSRDFRMGFEGIPERWDRRAPVLRITHLALD